MTESSKQAEFMFDRCNVSRISHDQVERLGFIPFPPVHGAMAFGVHDARYGFAIPYFDKDGQPNGLHRLRFETVTQTARKYLQPPGSDIGIYFPPLMERSWREVLDNPAELLTITEGELKACCGTIHGIPTVGLGGVAMWRKKGSGALHPDLARIKWSGRPVEIVFDSDMSTNTDIQRELYHITSILSRLGATVSSVVLSQPGADKVGLDDYLAQHSVEQYRKDVPREMVSEVDAIKVGYASRYLVSIAGRATVVYDLEKPNLSGSAMSKSAFIDATGGRCITEPDGKAIKFVSPGERYVQWPGKTQVDDITYAPGRPRIFESEGERLVNKWRSWGVTPCVEPVDVTDPVVSCWLDHLSLIFDGDKAKLRYFMQWLSWPIQNPTGRMLVAAFFHSKDRGIGKSLLYRPLKIMYGPGNWSKPTQQALKSSFNPWAVTHLAILDEFEGEDRRVGGAKLADLITSPTVYENNKYEKERQIPATAHYLIIANHKDCIKIRSNERRFFVHEVVMDEQSHEYYQRFEDLLLNEVGASKLMRYFIDYDMTGFTPMHRPPDNVDLEVAVSAGRDEFTDWLDHFADNLDEWSVANQKAGLELFTKNELVALFRASPSATNQTTQFLGRRLSEAHMVSKACERWGKKEGYVKEVRPNTNTKEGRVVLWAVRDLKKWESASREEAETHYQMYHMKGAEK